MTARAELAMGWFPMFLSLKDSSALVVGGGRVALRKVQQLLDLRANVNVVAPQISPELALLVESKVSWRAARFEPEMVLGHRLVIAATGDAAVNRLVAASAKGYGVLVNVVDDPSLCTFMVPAVVNRSPLMIAVGTGGAAPVLARQTKAYLESIVPHAIGRLARFMGVWRPKVLRQVRCPDNRRHLWERVVQGPIAEHLFAGRDFEAGQLMERMLDDAVADSRSAQGEVYIVGAGPGNPELLTLRALRLMQQCDVVLYDRLVSREILALVRRDAERINVGKRTDGFGWPQDRINQAMIRLAREGNRVLRLKGGDPLVFGRGGEEMEAVAASGIAYQVVPGITAASGCAAYAGIPLTHRNYAHSCVFVSGHDVENPAYDWQHLTLGGQTVVFYMALERIETICRKLMSHGLAGATPAALISRGSMPQQEVMCGTVSTLAETVAARTPLSPALLIVGEVASLADKLRWFNARSENAPDAQSSAEAAENRLGFSHGDPDPFASIRECME